MRTVEVDPQSLKLSTPVEKVTNTFFEVEGQTLQVNTIVCAESRDAARLHARLGQPERIFLHDKTITELVGKDHYLLTQAVYALELKPKKQSYRATFRAAALKECDPMAWNRMFNACRNNDYKAVEELKPSFKFSSRLQPRDPRAEVNRFEPRFGFPEFAVAVLVDTEAFALTPGQPGKTDPTPYWPSNDPELKALSEQAVKAHPDRVRALLGFVHSNMRYGGVTGSRWGVKQFLSQKTGQCWDFCDLFITLCRAQGIPARASDGQLLFHIVLNFGGHSQSVILSLLFQRMVIYRIAQPSRPPTSTAGGPTSARL
ncbi:hypothetical protein DYH09_33575, partial [bacterium CPR1]|nr:hypothetical protein [bacterium CPR1]